MATRNSEPDTVSSDENGASYATPYDRLRARLKGTVTVLGEIVNSDPELWT